MTMRLLVRTLGSPVPEEVPCASSSSVGDLLAALAAGDEGRDAQADRHKLICRGRVLHDLAAKLCDVAADGDVLVLLPRRSVAPCPPPPLEPSRGPTLREINAAIRDDLAAQGPSRLEAAEAAARREGRAGGGLPDTQALEQALLSGEMGALRAYLDQLQDALRGAGGLAAAGAGDAGAQEAAGDLPLTAALDLMLGLGGAAGGQAAAGQHGEEEEEEDEHEQGGSEEEETEEEEEEEEEYTDEDDEEYEEEGASEEEEEEEEYGGELEPPQVPDPDSRLLAELMEMGFAEQLCRNALLMGRNRFEPALEWLLEHVEDPAAADPLSDAQLARLYGRGPRRVGPAVDQGALAMLQDMGFDRHQAEQALRTFNNSLNAATGWLLNLGALAAAAPQPAAGGAQPAEEEQPAAAGPQQEGAEEGSGGAQSVRSSGSDEEGSQPTGREEVPGLASYDGSSNGSDEDEQQAQRRAAQAQAQAQAAPLAQQAEVRQGDEVPPGLDSDSDVGSSYEALD